MSRRQYITEAYLTAYMGNQYPTFGSGSDFDTPDQLIEFAEELIDGYVGAQHKWFQLDSSFIAGVYTPPDYEPETPVVKALRGRITQVIDAADYMLETWQQNAYLDGFFKTCNVTIIGGTGYGNEYLISNSLATGQITLTNIDGSPLTTAPLDTTSVYQIYQLGKFPRDRDVFYNTFQTPTVYYKSIPDPVREATAAQCAYVAQQGLTFFDSDEAFINSKHIGPYSYTRDPNATGLGYLIAPKAKMLLRGYMNRKGTMII